MLGLLLLFSFIYLVIGFFVSVLGCRYIYNREDTHTSGIKEIKSYFLLFWFAWPLFGIGLILDYCEQNKLIDKFFTNVIIKDKKND